MRAAVDRRRRHCLVAREHFPPWKPLSGIRAVEARSRRRSISPKNDTAPARRADRLWVSWRLSPRMSRTGARARSDAPTHAPASFESAHHDWEPCPRIEDASTTTCRRAASGWHAPHRRWTALRRSDQLPPGRSDDRLEGENAKLSTKKGKPIRPKRPCTRTPAPRAIRRRQARACAEAPAFRAIAHTKSRARTISPDFRDFSDAVATAGHLGERPQRRPAASPPARQAPARTADEATPSVAAGAGIAPKRSPPASSCRRNAVPSSLPCRHVASYVSTAPAR